MKLSNKIALVLMLPTGLAACAPDASDAALQEEQAAPALPQASSISEVSAQDASGLIAEDSAIVVLDVRTPAEFAEGHIEGAMNIDFLGEDFAGELARLDRSSTVVLHCKSGTRSAGALEVMKEQGFEDIVHMADGFDGWQAAGLPVKR